MIFIFFMKGVRVVLVLFYFLKKFKKYIFFFTF
jgi:hypothetical protein